MFRLTYMAGLCCVVMLATHMKLYFLALLTFSCSVNKETMYVCSGHVQSKVFYLCCPIGGLLYR